MGINDHRRHIRTRMSKNPFPLWDITLLTRIQIDHLLEGRLLLYAFERHMIRTSLVKSTDVLCALRSESSEVKAHHANTTRNSAAQNVWLRVTYSSSVKR